MKEWFCIFKGRKEGPYSLEDLKRHPRFTPDTLVWKEGFSEWVKAKFVKELEKIFKDEEKRKERKKQKKGKEVVGEVEILTARKNTPFLFWLLVVLIIVVVFVFYHYYFE